MYPAAIAEPSIVFVILMGMGTVLLGLTCIVFLCMLMSAIVKRFAKTDAPVQTTPAPSSAAPAAIENRGELVAAIAAAVAEELGADVSAIRILSLKKIDS